MAVAFDVAGVDAPNNWSVTSCTTASTTIAATADRAAWLVLAMAGNGSTGFSSSAGGVAGSAISGTDTTTSRTRRILSHGVIAPASGSQTGTMSWTTAQDAVLMMVVFNGCDQTTPFANGTTANGASGAPSITPSGSGARNMSAAALNGNFTPSSPSQTTRVSNQDNGNHVCTATTGAAGATHSWADGFAEFVVCAVHVAAPPPTVAITGTATASITEADVVSGGKTVIITLTDETFVANTIVPPVIESGDCTVSGSNTAQASWAVSHPAAVAGDLLIFNIAWDDSTTTTDVTEPAGPNGETLSEVNATPAASASTEVRCKAWYTIATGNWSASTVTFTPDATESWSATVIKVPAGEFDATTPIGASGIEESTTGTDTTVESPAFNAGATDGDGTLVWLAAVDTDPLSATNPTGWTIAQRQDLGAVAHGVAVRDAAVTDSESITAATWAIAGDSHCSVAYVVRAPTATPFESARQAIIDGLDSAQAEGTGWNAEVRDNLAVTTVVRTSDTVCTITLSAQAAYNITAQETITVTVPATALTGAGALVATPTFTVDASGGATTHATSGALTGPGSTVDGAASNFTPHATSGVLAGPGATVDGTASNFTPHATSGVLAGPGAVVDGAASSATARPSSGSLTGAGSAVAGTAARMRAHPTTGVLTGPGSAVAGSASSATTRPSSGALVGPGAAIAGAAARTRLHATSGVLAGPGAVIDGAAALPGAVTHATSGALAGSGAAVDGAAARTRQHATSGVLAGSGATLDAEASLGSGGWIFKREKYYRDVVEEEEKPSPPKKRVVRLIKRAAKAAVAEPPVITVEPLREELKIAALDFRPSYEELYWKAVSAEIKRKRLEIEADDEETILLLM